MRRHSPRAGAGATPLWRVVGATRSLRLNVVHGLALHDEHSDAADDESRRGTPALSDAC